MSFDTSAAGATVASPPSMRFRQHLSTRIVALSAIALTLVLTMIAGTLWLSWQLEGAGAAINDTGSLRMRANAVGIALMEARSGQPSRLEQEMSGLDATLDQLRHGNPARPLFLPDEPLIRNQFDAVVVAWNTRLRPAVSHDLKADLSTTSSTYLVVLPHFVAEANSLVSLIEQENARKTRWLRMSQIALAALSCIGTVAIVYLLYRWFVLPVQRLRDGLGRVEAREFGIRLPVETQDEFGHLAEGFNRMVAELQALYRDLAERVEAKTAQLAAQNRELMALYELAAFLNLPLEAEALSRGFLRRLMHEVDADGGTVRVTSAEDHQLHLLVSEGLSAELVCAEQCIPADDCVCGSAVKGGVSIVDDLRGEGLNEGALAQRCRREGFEGVAAFGIVAQGEALGSFSLHYRDGRSMPASQVQLMETLGKHLGVALKNRRLAALARQLAVSEERNLVAQGLHDSIAQGLNFLKMQVHLLDQAARGAKLDEIREIVPLLGGGIEESYDDVRELLLNFRTRLGSGELRDAVEESLARLRRQSGLEVTLDYREAGGLPLPADQQLQILFILQEALSNIRKHAEAQHVHVTLVNGRDFRLLIKDDGIGYDPAQIARHDELHVGFHIMRERASRLAAALKLDSMPGQGATVELILPASERKTA